MHDAGTRIRPETALRTRNPGEEWPTERTKVGTYRNYEE